jgi:hypothetical protein
MIVVRTWRANCGLNPKAAVIKLPKSVAAVFGVYSYCQKLKT